MNTATKEVDVRFLRLVLTSLILSTLISGGVCVGLAGAAASSADIPIIARF